MSLRYFVRVLPLLLYYLFILCIVLQCGYATYFLIRFSSLPSPATKDKAAKAPITVIICAKNEARNLEQNLPAIMAQRYTNETGKSMFEVIVVNDASTDDTSQVLQALEQRYDNLWSVHIKADATRDLKGKKFALSQGLIYSKHELLVLTDADCAPVDEYWLQNMSAPLIDGKEIVVGYGAYKLADGLLNAFTRWETLHTFLQYASYTLSGMPYMAVGRNLACTKQILQKAQANPNWNELPSGDDDLLISSMANEQNTTVVYNAHAYTISEAKHSWGDWIKQKQRHLSTGKYYKSKVKALLSLYASSHALLWLLFIALSCMGYFKWLLVLMTLRCAITWLLWAIAAAKLKEKSLFFLLPVFDLGWMLYNFAFAPYIIFKNKKQWT